MDKKQSIEDGLTAEESYFSNTEPWRGVEDKNLFGTKNLRVKLAELQMKLIQSSFMSIVSDLKSKRDESLELLHSLGAIPTTLSFLTRKPFSVASRKRFGADWATVFLMVEFPRFTMILK